MSQCRAGGPVPTRNHGAAIKCKVSLPIASSHLRWFTNCSPASLPPLPENRASKLKSGRPWARAYGVGNGAPIGGAYINWDLHTVVLKPVLATATPRRRVFCGAPDARWELGPVSELGEPGYVPPPKGTRVYVGQRLENWERETWETQSDDADVERSCFEGPLTPTSDIEDDARNRMPSEEDLHFVIAKVLAETGPIV